MNLRKKRSLGSIKFLGGMSRRNSSELKGQTCILPQVSKTSGDLKLLLLRQTIEAQEGPIWTIELSLDGKYLATAGKSTTIYIWTISTDKQAVIEEQSVKEFTGHTSDVVDLAWTNQTLLLSASLDHTVRLWHPEQQNCLRTFQHSHGVTSVSCFNDVFLSGSADRKVRLWDINQGRVTAWTRTNKAVTCVKISPVSGEIFAVGLAQGEVFFFKTKDMKYHAEIKCKNQYGQFKQGTKVTGLSFMEHDQKLLVTTNDSRLRIYCTTTFARLSKYKGHVNECMLIKANLSFSQDHIISGSENGCIYLWKVAQNTKIAGTVEAHERFAATASKPPIVTAACFAPQNVLDTLYGEGTSPLKLIISAGFDGLLKVIEAELK